MFCALQAAEIIGLDCVPVTVEIDLHKGQTNFSIVGLADASIKEAKDRLYSAIKNAGFDYPFNFRILVNLAPADIRKDGSVYDVPMAVGIITASLGVPLKLNNTMMIGELALDGSVRHVRGVLPLALWARERGIEQLFVPEEDAPEASLVSGLQVYAVRDLRELMAHVLGKDLLTPFVRQPNTFTAETAGVDMAHIKGHTFAKRALEVAASGAHNILMNGPPGAGKTLLARSLPTILPSLTEREMIEVTMIYSVAGVVNKALRFERPFRSPHHTTSGAALVGGGRLARPGEISLSHRGVLFLDELPEFSRFVIESLRQPLEDGVVSVARVERTVTYPARFMLVASQNPCPCGYATDDEKQCMCTPSQLVRYQKKLSGPLLDRIDLHVEVPRLPFETISSAESAEPSEWIRERVLEARERQAARFKDAQWHTNSEMDQRSIEQFCPLDEASRELLRAAVKRYQLSARSYNRLIKVSRTIADLSSKDRIGVEHVAEALQFRLQET